MQQLYRLKFRTNSFVGEIASPLKGDPVEDFAGEVRVLLDEIPYTGQAAMSLALIRGFIVNQYLQDAMKADDILGVDFLPAVVEFDGNYELWAGDGLMIPSFYYCRVRDYGSGHDLFWRCASRSFYATEKFRRVCQSVPQVDIDFLPVSYTDFANFVMQRS